MQRFLLVFWVSFLALSSPASALEIYRNSRPYYLNISLPYGGEFYAQGLDHVFDIDGVKGILRLIQDTPSSCNDLVEERISNKAEDGFALVRRNSTRGECYVELASLNGGEVISTFYIWLNKCSCFAALHVWDAPSQKTRRDRILQALLDQLRGKPAELAVAEANVGASKPDVVVTSRGREGASKASARCYACFLDFAWGKWHDNDGGPHMSIGMGWGSSRIESQNNAMTACNEKGYNCKLTEAEGAGYGGCGYISIGSKVDSVAAATADTRARALELCGSDGDDCDEPIGGCTNRPPS